MNLSRLMLAGSGGDCGKTLVALGLAETWRREGIAVAPFKKGPDYIDAAWLAMAAGRATRNLDTWMMGREKVLDSFARNAISEGINLLEANRGLHDGEDARGTHSSAQLSKLLNVPIVLIIPAVKVTRTVAAVALGIRMLDPQVRIAGIILNRLATQRQEGVIRNAVENEAGLPVLGAIPRIRDNPLPSRHLGLVTPEEHLRARQIIETAAEIVRQSVDTARLRKIAADAGPLNAPEQMRESVSVSGQGLRIGVFQSPAFTFYYPENLEAIDQCGATRVPVDPLGDRALPDLDALYIGGGFPETHAGLLAENAGFRLSVAAAAAEGLPVWAECGGLMFLSRAVHWKGKCYPMAGVLPADVRLGEAPAGHGYEEAVVDRPNPFLEVGTTLRGHEFHYSRLEPGGRLDSVLDVTRGTGVGGGRDGIIMYNILASYMHLHALGSPEWTRGLMRAAARFHPSRHRAPQDHGGDSHDSTPHFPKAVNNGSQTKI